jgi:D-alanyl-D-alanine carboxypeptidase/D-alanyl-D-alanine-endopeptidase (penicillin-binding protein 4)
MIRPMLKYSTNFIANQLILMLSAKSYHRPANFVDVQNYMEETLRRQFNWQAFTMKDGAGLSRENRLSPEQLVQLLGVFKPWTYLLPQVTPGVYAKSGTLNKVSTLAGYAVNSKQQWLPFALMMKQSVSHRRRNMIARKLANQ